MTSLEQLIAFNDEVASLTQAGIPIDLGLSQLSRDADNASDQINAALARRMKDGVSLVDAMSTEDPLFPPIYRNLVVAGLRCGRLPAALEVQSRYTQSLLDLRQSLRSALVYPLIICVLAYLLFMASCLIVAPAHYHELAEIGSDRGVVFRIVRMLRDSMPIWVAIPPVLLAVLYVGFRSSSRRMTVRGCPRLMKCWPGVSRVIADQRWATFAELLALLVEHEVPLHEGLRLAAGASGDRKVASAAQEMADDVEQEHLLTQDGGAAQPFPPFLRWALTRPTEAGDLARTLRLAAQTYRHRAERRTKWLRTMTPMFTCGVLAGGVTLLYCLSVFGPLVRLMKDLS